MISITSRAILSTRETAELRSILRAVFCLLAAALACVIFAFLPHAQILAAGTVALLFLAFKGVTFLMETKIGAEKLAQRGVVGEEPIAEILDHLGSEHVIVHDVVCPAGKIDHVVVSKQHGIFLIETVAYGSKVEVVDSRILVNGKRPETDFIAQTLRNTHWLAEQLEAITEAPAKVHSLVVFADAFVMTSRAVKGITITNKKFLLQSIHRLGKPLAPELWEAREKMASLAAAAR